MRDNMTPDILGAIGAPTITTALLARLEFKSETVFVWTGVDNIIPTGSGDTALDGNTFDALAAGVVEFGQNSFSKNGSDELEVTLAVPSTPHTAIAAATVYPSEYQARPVVLWRGIKLPQANPLAPPVWMFRRIRSGKIDHVEITNDGQSHNFKLTIESHQANITNASNQSYLNQKRFDRTDTSQDYAVSIANGQPAPAKSTGIIASGGSGGQLLNKIGEPMGDLPIE